MKGPYERLKYDLRRVWACPICQHRERTGGESTSRLCPCQATVEPAERRYMTLVDDGCRRLIPREPMVFSEDWYLPPEPVPVLDEETPDDSASIQVDSGSTASDANPTDQAATDQTVRDVAGSDVAVANNAPPIDAAVEQPSSDETRPRQTETHEDSASEVANVDTATVLPFSAEAADSSGTANIAADGDATGDARQDAGNTTSQPTGTPRAKSASPRSRGREKRRGRGRKSGRGRRGKSSGGGGGGGSSPKS